MSCSPLLIKRVAGARVRLTLLHLESLRHSPTTSPSRARRSSAATTTCIEGRVSILLDRHRLVTLVGSGGVGKTRLAIQAGAGLLDHYSDGVWFVGPHRSPIRS